MRVAYKEMNSLFKNVVSHSNFKIGSSIAFSIVKTRLIVNSRSLGAVLQRSLFGWSKEQNAVENPVWCRCYSSQSRDLAKRFNFIADAAEIAAPAVVYVEVKVQTGGILGGVAQGAGSGFAVTDYGVIMTNAHVISHANSIEVKLASGDVC